MTSQNGGGGVPSGAAGGALTGTYPSPTLAAGQVPLELGYVQATANFTTASTTLVDVTSMTLTVTVGTRPIMVEFFSSAADSMTNTGDLVLTAIIDVTASVQIGGSNTINAATQGSMTNPKVRVSPVAGSRTYKVQMRVSGTGTGRLQGSSVVPMWFRIYEI